MTADPRPGGVDSSIASLRAELGDRVLVDPDRMSGYLRDQCLTAGAGQPRAVVRARSTSDVEVTMRLASASRFPVVVRGAGTGLAGGANAIDGCILLALGDMSAILDVDPAARLAVVQPGVINADLDAASALVGLQYFPDPGSRAISTIGGNIATNAGGMCCARYGVTSDHVAGLRAVLPSGETITTGSRTRKNVTGLDLTRLLVGSEGTLAVIVEATVRLHPRISTRSTAVATFSSTSAAIDTALDISRTCTPSALEVMDHTTVAAVNAMTGMDIDPLAAAVLLATFDGREGAGEALVFSDVAQRHDARDVFLTDDVDDGDLLMEARRAALPALERLGTTLLDDVAVPVTRLAEMMRCIEEVAADAGLTIGTFGHAADGNLHPTIIFDPASSTQRTEADVAFHRIIQRALALGGAVSGEHGVGSLKREYVEEMYGRTELLLMHRLKAAFDPLGILNPGRAY